jgi:TIGR03009 family protein
MQAILKEWQKSAPQQFTCKFTRWDYDTTFGPKNNDYLMTERHGEIKFRAPDNGIFRETEMKVYVPPKNSQDPQDRGHYESSKEQLEHWVCDGEKIYQLKTSQKILEVTELPPDMHGKAIAEGMLRFLFPIDAKSIAARYWLCEKTPQDSLGKHIWLELWPKSALEASSFRKVEVILELPTLRLLAFQITTPNGRDRSAYLLENWQIDSQAVLSDVDFRPVLPIGWKRVSAIAPPAAQSVAPAVPAATSEEKPVKSVLKSRPGLSRFNCRGWVR